MRPAVFLDRDGVLNELVADSVSGQAESPLSVEDVRLMPGAAHAAARLRQAGYTLVCVTNQPAAAKGRVAVAQLYAVHARVIDLLAGQGVTIDASRLCLHHADGVVPELSRRCSCRKPAPGMLLDAAATLDLDLSTSWMVGDTDADVIAGHAAGCATALVRTSGSAHKRLQAMRADLVVDSLRAAAEELCARTSETITQI